MLYIAYMYQRFRQRQFAEATTQITREENSYGNIVGYQVMAIRAKSLGCSGRTIFQRYEHQQHGVPRYGFRTAIVKRLLRRRGAGSQPDWFPGNCFR